MNSFAIVTKKRIRAFALILLFLTVSITLALISPENIIEHIGTSNAVLLMFIFGTMGGLTTFTGVPYHLILASFSAGGVHPIILGTATALGVMIGDSTMYFLGKNIAPALPVHFSQAVQKIGDFFDTHPTLFVPTLFLYGSVCPFSNDWIVASLSIHGYSFWKIITPLALGNIVFNIGIAYLGIYGYDAFSLLF